MSLIHWDKSVLSFHLKEIIEDGHGGHPVAFAGLSAIAISSLLVYGLKEKIDVPGILN